MDGSGINGNVDVVASLPTSTRQVPVIVAFMIMFVTATMAVGLRFYTRIKILAGLKKEDYLILVAWVFSLGTTIGFIRQTNLALGHHVWTLTPEIATASAMEEWYSFLFYVLSLSFTKVSILFLYLRILPSGPARKANYVLMAFVIVCNLWAVIAMFISCIPLQALWDKSIDGKCLNLGVQLGNAVLNIVTDFAIFTLPLPSIARLQMHWRKKVGLLSVFVLGFVVCIISIARIVQLATMDKSDFPYDMAYIAYWGAVEVNLPIICACLATIKPLLNSWFPRLLGSSAARSQVEYGRSMGGTFSGDGGKHINISAREMVSRAAREDLTGDRDSSEELVFKMRDIEATAGRQDLNRPMKAYGKNSELE